MKRKMLFTASLCLVFLISTLTSEGGEIQYLMKMGDTPEAQARRFSLLSHRTAAQALQTKAQTDLKPPLSAGRVTNEILTGGLGSFAFGVVGGYIGLIHGGNLGFHTLEDDISAAGALVVGGVGAIVGSTLGVYLVGNFGDETGSFLATLGGSLLGAAVLGLGGAGLDLLNRHPRHGFEPEAVFIGMWVGMPIGATVGFNLSRRYESPPTTTGTALINFSEGQMRLAVPTISFQPAPYDRGAVTQTVNVVRGRF